MHASSGPGHETRPVHDWGLTPIVQPTPISSRGDRGDHQRGRFAARSRLHDRALGRGSARPGRRCRRSRGEVRSGLAHGLQSQRDLERRRLQRAGRRAPRLVRDRRRQRAALVRPRAAVADLELREQLAHRLRGLPVRGDVGCARRGGSRPCVPAPRRERLGGPRPGRARGRTRRRPADRPSRRAVRGDLELRLDPRPRPGSRALSRLPLRRPRSLGGLRPAGALPADLQSRLVPRRPAGVRRRLDRPRPSRRSGVGAGRRPSTPSRIRSRCTTDGSCSGCSSPRPSARSTAATGAISAIRSAIRSAATRSTRSSPSAERSARARGRSAASLAGTRAAVAGGRPAGSATAPRSWRSTSTTASSTAPRSRAPRSSATSATARGRSLRRLFAPPGWRPVLVRNMSAPPNGDRRMREWTRVTSLTQHDGLLFASVGSCTSAAVDAPADVRGTVHAFAAGVVATTPRTLEPGRRHIAAVRRGGHAGDLRRRARGGHGERGASPDRSRPPLRFASARTRPAATRVPSIGFGAFDRALDAREISALAADGPPRPTMSGHYEEAAT